MKNMPLLHLKNIEEYHQLFQMAKPGHPLISVINLASLQYYPFSEPTRLVYDFYCIALKRTPDVTFKYGQQEGSFRQWSYVFHVAGPGVQHGHETG